MYNYGSSNETRNGPNIYSARCISPDGSWHGDFNEKSITVEPAFPEDLRATNNGPALTGDPSVRLAVTNVPDVSYAWAGPNGFVSGIRNPEITALSAAKSGIYTVTLTKGAGQAWGCGVTATTNVAVKGCENLGIKLVEGITSREVNTISLEKGSTSIFQDMVLFAYYKDGSQMQTNRQFSWTHNGNVMPNANNYSIITNQSGVYEVTMSSSTPENSCKQLIIVGEEEFFNERWDKVVESNFRSNIPVSIVSLEPKGYNLATLPNSVKATQPRFKLLSYTLNDVAQKTLMVVLPYASYLQSNNYKIGTNFSGSIMFYNYSDRVYLGGWRYENGNPRMRIQSRQMGNGWDGCWKHITIMPCFNCDGGKEFHGFNTENQSPEVYLSQHQEQDLLISIPYDCNGKEPSYPVTIPTNPPVPPSNPIPDDFGSTTWINTTTPPIATGGGDTNTNSPIFIGVLDENNSGAYVSVNQKVQLALSEIIEELSKVKGSFPLTNSELEVLINELVRQITNRTGLVMNPVSSPAFSGFTSNIRFKQYSKAAFNIMSLVQPVNPTITPDEAFNYLMNEKENIKAHLLTYIYFKSKFGQSIGFDLFNAIDTGLRTANKSIGTTLINYGGDFFSEEQDITRIWNILSTGLTVSSPKPNTQQVTKPDGTVITYTLPTATTSASISLKNGANEVVVNRTKITNNLASQGMPCAGKIHDKILKLNGFKIVDLLQKYFGANSNFNVTFEVDNNLSGTLTDGYAKGGGTFGVTIAINPDLNNATQEYVVATLLHEAVHGYLNILKSNFPNDYEALKENYPVYFRDPAVNQSQEKLQHTLMVFEWVNEITKVITSMYPNYPLIHAQSISWGGLTTTRPYQLLANPDVKQQQNNINAYESGRTPGTKVGATQNPCN